MGFQLFLYYFSSIRVPMGGRLPDVSQQARTAHFAMGCGLRHLVQQCIDGQLSVTNKQMAGQF
jgi:hypothetical protein